MRTPPSLIRASLPAVEHAIGLGDVGGVQGHDVAVSEQVVQRQQLGAQGGGLGGGYVRVVQQYRELERPEQFEEPHGPPGTRR